MAAVIAVAIPAVVIPVFGAGLSAPRVALSTSAAPPSGPAFATQRAVAPSAPEQITSGTPSIPSPTLAPPLSCIG